MSTRNIMSAALPLMAAAILTATPTARALQPDQIAVIVNSKSIGSQEVAAHYCKVRHIPTRNIIGLPLSTQDTVPAAYFSARMAGPIRRALIAKKLRHKIVCLVTTFGVPLRIGPQAPTSENVRELAAVRKTLGQALGKLGQITTQMLRVARTQPKQANPFSKLFGPGVSSPMIAQPPAATPTTRPGAATTRPGKPQPNATTKPVPAKKPLSAIVTQALVRFQKAEVVLFKHINTLTPAEKGPAIKQALGLMQQAIGPSGVLPMIHLGPDTPPNNPMARKLAVMARKVAAAGHAYLALFLQRQKRANRVKMRTLQLKYFGMVGLIKQCFSDIPYLSRQRSTEAVDNALMLLWLKGRYHSNWMANPYYLPAWSPLVKRSGWPKVMMVSRLDGLTPANVIKMIDTSIRVEKKGLRGVAYFDARGLGGKDPYAVFDGQIRHAAKFIKAHSRMKVVLDNTPALLQAKNCPAEAIYCGWYSVHHFVNSCQWLPGSVAYHVASFEMVSLHNPKETGWCVNLLERGVCGTLGAVDEPYLVAFPPPRLFFALLLSGRFTQAEAYYMTCPVVGWRIGYVGDPLYNPFKRDPQISKKTLMADPILKKAFAECKTWRQGK